MRGSVTDRISSYDRAWSVLRQSVGSSTSGAGVERNGLAGSRHQRYADCLSAPGKTWERRVVSRQSGAYQRRVVTRKKQMMTFKPATAICCLALATGMLATAPVRAQDGSPGTSAPPRSIAPPDRPQATLTTAMNLLPLIALSGMLLLGGVLAGRPTAQWRPHRRFVADFPSVSRPADYGSSKPEVKERTTPCDRG